MWRSQFRSQNLIFYREREISVIWKEKVISLYFSSGKKIIPFLFPPQNLIFYRERDFSDMERKSHIYLFFPWQKNYPISFSASKFHFLQRERFQWYGEKESYLSIFPLAKKLSFQWCRNKKPYLSIFPTAKKLSFLGWINDQWLSIKSICSRWKAFILAE